MYMAEKTSRGLWDTAANSLLSVLILPFAFFYTTDRNSIVNIVKIHIISNNVCSHLSAFLYMHM